MNVEPSSFFCADTQEKVNLSRRRYGMPANITISAKGNAGCAPVIMIQTSDLDWMDSRHLLTMSVADKKLPVNRDTCLNQISGILNALSMPTGSSFFATGMRVSQCLLMM